MSTALDTALRLKTLRIYVTTGQAQKAPLRLFEDEVSLDEYFTTADDRSLVETLLDRVVSPDDGSIHAPFVLDMPKAVSVLRGTEDKNAASIRQAVLVSRFSFMGTDGIRGKVSGGASEPVDAFIKSGEISPQLLRMLSASFASILLESGILLPGSAFCMANDGRDQASGWMLREALRDGLMRCGLDVIDLGVNPTPMLPWYMLTHGHRAGAMLTASHNPANQNGLKFFLDGLKILPEGKPGDFEISARLFEYARGIRAVPDAEGTIRCPLDCAKDFTRFMCALNNDFPRSTVPRLVLDNANGAYSLQADAIFKNLAVDFIGVNEIPRGSNINAGCGVAEVEGKTRFVAADYDCSIPAVRSVFDLGRKLAGRVYGIVLDGDGDRGFVLCYDTSRDEVMVLNGDLCGFIIARLLLAQNRKPAHFVVTVESDLMVSAAAQRELKLPIGIVGVGDKWICNFPKELFIGIESSGHVIIPLRLEDSAAPAPELKAGNGLITALWCIKAIESLGIQDPSHPYDTGYSRTRYTYYVDKTRFYPGTAVWNEDQDTIKREYFSGKKSGAFPEHSDLCFANDIDPTMLCARIVADGSVAAAVFIRNSGTEDKTAVYVQCARALAETMDAIAGKIQRHHATALKNQDRAETIVENAIILAIERQGTINAEELARLVKEALDDSGSENLIAPVLHSLKKEQRICDTAHGYSLC